MSKKIVFYDADGTVLNKGALSPRVLRALEELRQNDVITVLSTGRSLPSIRYSDLSKLDISNAITAAGGAVFINNALVSHDCIQPQHLKELLNYMDQYHLVYNLECNDSLYCPKGSKESFLNGFYNEHMVFNSDKEKQEAIERRERWDLQVKECDDLLSLEVNKLHWFENQTLYPKGFNPIDYTKVMSDLSQDYNVVPLTFSRMGGGEINEKGITKEKGMKILIDHYSIAEKDVYAIGDGLNDLQMLNYATHSIAMGNAEQEVKDIAEYICVDVEHDGFIDAMKHYGLLKD